MTLNRGNVFQLFKYAVYTLLTVNIFIFWREEFLAAQLQFSGNVPLLAASIDPSALIAIMFGICGSW